MGVFARLTRVNPAIARSFHNPREPFNDRGIHMKNKTKSGLKAAVIASCLLGTGLAHVAGARGGR